MSTKRGSHFKFKFCGDKRVKSQFIQKYQKMGVKCGRIFKFDFMSIRSIKSPNI